MNIDDVGYGAGGGFLSGIIATVLTALGVNRRIDKLEKSVVYKDTFDATLKPLDTRLTRIEDKIDSLISRRREDRE